MDANGVDVWIAGARVASGGSDEVARVEQLTFVWARLLLPKLIVIHF